MDTIKQENTRPKHFQKFIIFRVVIRKCKKVSKFHNVFAWYIHQFQFSTFVAYTQWDRAPRINRLRDYFWNARNYVTIYQIVNLYLYDRYMSKFLYLKYNVKNIDKLKQIHINIIKHNVKNID